MFKTLLGREDLLVNHDRAGLFRPTVGVGEKKENKESWKTTKNLHFDMSPWDYVADEDDSKSQSLLKMLNYSHQSHFIMENNEVGCLKTGIHFLSK